MRQEKLSCPRVAQRVVWLSIIAATVYMATPMTPVTMRPANTSGTSKRDDATIIRWPMPDSDAAMASSGVAS